MEKGRKYDQGSADKRWNGVKDDKYKEWRKEGRREEDKERKKTIRKRRNNSRKTIDKELQKGKRNKLKREGEKV